jgi:hypothetical protein
MTFVKGINLFFALLGIISGLYIIYSVTIRTISHKIEIEVSKMEKDILNKLNGKIA